GARAAPAPEAVVERFLLPVGRVMIFAGGVGLPDFEQHVAQRRSGPIDDAPLDADAFALRFRTDQHMGEIPLENVESRLLRRKADMHIGARRLRCRLFQIVAVGNHSPHFLSMASSAWTWFSNQVARAPRKTMSKRYARLSSGMAACLSSVAINCRIAASLGIERTIGQCAISGSPSK